MRVQDIKWKQHFTLEQIYGNLPKASDVVSMRRNRFTATVYVRTKKSYLTFSSGLSHIRKEEESHSAIQKHL